MINKMKFIVFAMMALMVLGAGTSLAEKKHTRTRQIRDTGSNGNDKQDRRCALDVYRKGADSCGHKGHPSGGQEGVG